MDSRTAKTQPCTLLSRPLRHARNGAIRRRANSLLPGWKRIARYEPSASVSQWLYYYCCMHCCCRRHRGIPSTAINIHTAVVTWNCNNTWYLVSYSYFYHQEVAICFSLFSYYFWGYFYGTAVTTPVVVVGNIDVKVHSALTYLLGQTTNIKLSINSELKLFSNLLHDEQGDRRVLRW